VPHAVTFGGWVVQNGAQIEGDTITWQGDVAAGGEERIVFTATLGTDPALRGTTIVATAYLTTTTTGDGVAWGLFTVESYRVCIPLIIRNW